MSNLTDTQLVILSAASQRENRRVLLPDHLRGGVATKVLTTLAVKGLIEPLQTETIPLGTSTPGMTDYCISKAGLAALGLDDETGMPTEPAPEIALELQSHAEVDHGAPSTPKPDPQVPKASVGGAEPTMPRAGSKQSALIDLLSREDGASIAEIAAALDWLPHTTRAALTGLRHKGYDLEREAIGGERGSIYRITVLSVGTGTAQIALSSEAA